MIISSQSYRLHENISKEVHTGRNNEEEQDKIPMEFKVAKKQKVNIAVFGCRQDAMIALYCPKTLCSQYAFNNAYN